jgi:hypothetical protein
MNLNVYFTYETQNNQIDINLYPNAYWIIPNNYFPAYNQF